MLLLLFITLASMQYLLTKVLYIFHSLEHFQVFIPHSIVFELFFFENKRQQHQQQNADKENSCSFKYNTKVDCNKLLFLILFSSHLLSAVEETLFEINFLSSMHTFNSNTDEKFLSLAIP